MTNRKLREENERLKKEADLYLGNNNYINMRYQELQQKNAELENKYNKLLKKYELELRHKNFSNNFKGERINLEMLKTIQRGLKDKDPVIAKPLMPTFYGLSIEEIIDEFIKVKSKEALTVNVEYFKREIEREKIKAEMIEDVIKHYFPNNKLYKRNERSEKRRELKELSSGNFCLYMSQFYNERLGEKAAEREEIIKIANGHAKKMQKLLSIFKMVY